MMCHRLCLVLLAIAQGLRDDSRLELELVESPLEELRRNASDNGTESWSIRRDAAMSPQLAELVRENSSEAVEILRGLAKDKYRNVRAGVAQSSALKDLVQTRPDEGAQLVWELAKRDDKDVVVRSAVARSWALEALVKVRPEEAAKVVMELVEDAHWNVRYGVAASSALKALVEVRREEGFQVVMSVLESDRDLRLRRDRFPWWPAFREYATPLANAFNRSLENGSLEEIVSVARNSSWRAVLNLNWEDGKRLFAKLIQDPDPHVRYTSVDAPAWSTLFRYDVAAGMQFFKNLSERIANDAREAELRARKMIAAWVPWSKRFEAAPVQSLYPPASTNFLKSLAAIL